MRYLRVLGIFYKAAILTDLEYRANFVTNVLMSIVTALATIFTMGVFFQHTDSLGGWTYNEALIVLGLFQFFLGMVDTFISPNVRDFTEHLRLGTMDFILTKPLNSQFHASLRRINIWRSADMLIGAGIIVYALHRLNVTLTPDRLAMFGALLACAAIILYALIMLLITSAFWFVQLENVMELMFTFYEAGRFPVNVFPNAVRLILTFVVPIAFITTVPAAVVLGRLNAEFVLFALIVTTVLFAACVAFWRFAVKHYSSASS